MHKPFAEDDTSSSRCRSEIEQDLIGWDHFLDGLASARWSEEQTDYYKTRGMRKTGRRWLTQLLLKFWGVCWDLWNIRNEWEHHRQLSEQEQIIRNDVEHEIHKGFLDLPRLQHLYTTQRLLDLRVSSISYQRAWLLNLKASRRRVAKRGVSHDELKGMQALMRRFLTKRVES